MSNARHFLKPIMRLCGYDIDASKLLSTFDGLSQEKKMNGNMIKSGKYLITT